VRRETGGGKQKEVNILVDSASIGDVGTFHAMLAIGADAKGVEDYVREAAVIEGGKTAAHAAAANGRIGILETLFPFKAPFPFVDIDIRDAKGNTPLGSGATEGQVAAVELLLDRGGDVDAQNEEGESVVLNGDVPSVRNPCALRLISHVPPACSRPERTRRDCEGADRGRG